MLKDLALNEKGDLYISSGGDFAIVDSLRQAIQIKLRWALGEWQYNTDLGIPYFEKILVKKPNVAEVTNIIRNALLEFQEVTSIKSCQVTLDDSARTATCHFGIQAGEETIESEVGSFG